MPSRREFLRTAALLALTPQVLTRGSDGVWVNDIHSQLNRTRVRRVEVPRTADELVQLVRTASRRRIAISVSGCRHSMGGQQFATDSICVDTRKLARVLDLDCERGLLEAEAGVQWPQIIAGYTEAQHDSPRQWAIAQKQTGADTFTLGGSLASNVHGRGLTMKPLIADVEAFTLVGADGTTRRCSREENPELFRAVIGGYGLFGIVTRVTLRLVPRRKLRRRVETLHADNVIACLEERTGDGYTYGDFQFSIDEKSPDFLQQGIVSCYQPIGDEEPVTAQKALGTEDWLDLLALAYTDRAKGYQRYVDYYLSTDGQTYWSDTHQLSAYLPNYAEALRKRIGTDTAGNLLISELYVPRSRLADFLKEASDLLRSKGPPVIYGTVRLIKKDSESLLAWARESYACVIFNLLTPPNSAGMAASSRAFRSLTDLALARNGSFYLTYHRFADREQVSAAYPKFSDFLELKRHYDPKELFQSEWYRHQRLFS